MLEMKVLVLMLASFVGFAGLNSACHSQAEPCTAHSQCPDRKRCDKRLGLCINPRPEGAPCTHDDQCIHGSCTTPNGADEMVCD